MKRFISLLPVLALMACASAQVSSEYDKTADLSRYRTYAWITGTQAANPLIEQRIKSAVDQQLAARGLKRVKESPDLQVATHASTRVEQQVNTESLGYGYAEAGWSGNMVNVRNVDVGTLLLDLVDASSQQLVWRGMATAVVGHTMSQEKMDKTVGKMLSSFPRAKG